MATEPTSVDVVVLGCGAAGVTAALAARRSGAQVLVIEHQAEGRHTPNTRMSGGWLMTVVEEQAGRRYLAECARGLVDEEMFDGWARGAVELPATLEAMGVELDLADTATWGLSRLDRDPEGWSENPEIAGSEAVRVWRTATTLPSTCPEAGGMARATGRVSGGEALYRGLMHAMRDAGVEVAWESEPTELIVERDATGTRVTGVRYRRAGRAEAVLARSGVVIATGGFGASAELIREFLTVPDTRFYGNPGNDGSGLKLAMSVGAQLVRMNRMVGRGVMSFELADGSRLSFMVIMKGGGYLICDQAGRRYQDEYDQAMQQHSVYQHMAHFDHNTHSYSRAPSYYVFDDRRFKAGPLTYTDRGVCGVGLYDWSADNRRELDAGWIAVGASPAEAAAKAGAPTPYAVDEAVAEYNRSCSLGTDPFGRPADTLVPLDQPPYYCVPLYVGGPYLTGGPGRNAGGQILDVHNRPIAGLYGAGELGQPIGLLYPAQGASLSEALCGGAVSGASAASMTTSPTTTEGVASRER